MTHTEALRHTLPLHRLLLLGYPAVAVAVWDWLRGWDRD